MARIKKSVRVALDAAGFTVTKIIYDSPPMSFLPAVYQDDQTKRWAVREPGAQPVIFSYEDILDCQIIETSVPKEDIELGKDRQAWGILTNPARVSRENAVTRKDMCPGLGVVVLVRTGEGDAANLQLPLLTREMKRDSKAFAQIMEAAEQLKDEFDTMKAQS